MHIQSSFGLGKKLITVLLAASLIGHVSAREGWMTDIEVAKKAAAKEGKDILIEFTRSEGCGWCIKLEKEVLAQDAFKEQVAKSYVLVVLNFPRDEKEWSKELKKKNEALARHYQVHTFPYLVACDATGRPYAGMIYRNSNGENYIKKLAKLPERRVNRDLAFAEAKKLEGEDKARALEKSLTEVSRKFYGHYPDIITAIAKADPSDISGFVSRIRIDEVKADLAELLKPLYEGRKFSEIPAAVDGFIDDQKLTGEALQVALLNKVQALYMVKQYPAAVQVADEIIAINDSSRASRFAKILKKRIERINKK